MTDKNDLSRRQRQHFNQLAADMDTVLKTASGQRVMRWLIDRSGVFLSNQSPEYDAGRRELGLEMIRAMDASDPYAFVRLMQEGAREQMELRVADKRKQTDAD